ncbi:acyl-CoA carboxylase epsilon subunit, partial [Cellulosimicrobium funkei]
MRVVRGAPDELEVATRVAGLAAAAPAGGQPHHVAPRGEWTNPARLRRG